MIDEIDELEEGDSVLLLGDIVDPCSEGIAQARILYEMLLKCRVRWIPGNNDRWLKFTSRGVPLWREFCDDSPTSSDFLPWLFTMQGGNYSNLPWSKCHQEMSIDDEMLWCDLVRMDCPSRCRVLASHFPFVCQTDGGRPLLSSWWQNALRYTKIDTLVFGHVHDDFKEFVPSKIDSLKIVLVSDHSGKRILKRI